MSEIETVRVASPVSDDNPHGYIVKNKSDVADGDVLFDAPAAEQAPRKARKGKE